MIDHLLAWHAAGREAVAGDVAIRRCCRPLPDGLELASSRICWPDHPVVHVLAVGKAAVAMARAMRELLGPRLGQGLVIARDPGSAPIPGMDLLLGDHPVPGERSLAAAQAATAWATACRPDDCALVLLSGGASALLADPRPPWRLADLQRLTGALLASGADIRQLNLVRQATATLKGGGLARLLAPTRVITLAISDVPGDDPAVIGSGPTAVPLAGDAAALITELGCNAMCAGPVQRPPADPLDHADPIHLVASNDDARAGVIASASQQGYTLRDLGGGLAGSAAAAGTHLAERLAELPPGSGFVIGGEPTVDLPADHGRGGRMQHLALAAAIALDGRRDCLLLAAGTDGSDGPDPIAGAWVDGDSALRARQLGFDPDAQLRRCDSQPLLQALDQLLITGPTGTNVMDLVIGWRC